MFSKEHLQVAASVIDFLIQIILYRLRTITSRHEMSLGDLNHISIERHLRDLSEIPEKKWLFCDVFKTSKTYLEKNVLSISQKRCIFRDVSGTSQKHLSQVFVIFQKYPTKMVLCDIRKGITISDTIDVRPLETLKKLNVFWEQCMNFNKVCHEHQWADTYVRVLLSQRS